MKIAPSRCVEVRRRSSCVPLQLEGFLHKATSFEFNFRTDRWKTSNVLLEFVNRLKLNDLCNGCGESI
ncbi:unnamed protein product [Soboliphyme baturini]|uniref:Uncharacterized protein n=1 Tax=Soboliphyme baturini TaxID=241478 RepID=A0A183J9D5_9BILA|nr:unnamed protein product [Soboliphyme baturini]